MLDINFRLRLYGSLFLCVALMISSCNKEEIVLPVSPDKSFYLSGTLQGQTINHDEQNIMITNTYTEEEKVVYEGNMHFNCENLMLDQCDGSLLIKIYDDTSSQIDGVIPSILQIGTLDFQRTLQIPGNSRIELRAHQPDSGIHRLEESFIPDTILQLDLDDLPLYPIFKKINGTVVVGEVDMVRGFYVEHYNFLISNMNGQIVYYYLDLDCIDQSFGMTTVQAVLRTNSSAVIDDLDFFYGGEYKNGIELRWPALPGIETFIQVAAKAPNTLDTLHMSIISTDAQLTTETSICASWVSQDLHTDSVTVVDAGHIVLEYHDADGRIYRSTGMGSTDYFEILSFESNGSDDFGNPTVRARLKFNATLQEMSSGEELILENFEGEFAFGY